MAFKAICHLPLAHLCFLAMSAVNALRKEQRRSPNTGWDSQVKGRGVRTTVPFDVTLKLFIHAAVWARSALAGGWGRQHREAQASGKRGHPGWPPEEPAFTPASSWASCRALASLILGSSVPPELACLSCEVQRLES